MKIEALILLLFFSSGSVAQVSMHPYYGSDFYGQGLSYPEGSFSSFPAQNETTGLKSVYLGATAFQPNNSSIKSLNSSDYYHITHPIWDQFAYYLPLTNIHECVTTPTINQFRLEDRYRAGVEPHDDPGRMGLNNFLDSDEPPGRPLL